MRTTLAVTNKNRSAMVKLLVELKIASVRTIPAMADYIDVARDVAFAEYSGYSNERLALELRTHSQMYS